MTTPPPAVLARLRTFVATRERMSGTDPEVVTVSNDAPLLMSDLRAAIDCLAQQGEAKPFAWFTEDYRDDKSATTYDPVVAERWRNKGWPVSPLFANHASADEAAIIAAYKRGAQWALENGAICAPYLGKAARDYADKTAALQPAATSEGENNGQS